MTNFITYKSIGLLFKKHCVAEKRLGRWSRYPWYGKLAQMLPASIAGYVFIRFFKMLYASNPVGFDLMTEQMIWIARHEVQTHGISLEEASAFWDGVRSKIFAH